MLWNWYTLDACFLANSWHITSAGMFGGSCIGVIALVMLLEFIRRVQREWDAYVLRGRSSRRLPSLPKQRQQNLSGSSSSSSSADNNKNDDGKTPRVETAEPRDGDGDGAASGSGKIGGGLLMAQTIRAFIYTCQFAVAYIVMLLAMYYNGYIIICIFIGAFLGHFTFGWDLAKKSYVVPCSRLCCSS